MISPELLRRYPFFGSLDEAQLRAIAMLSEEVEVAQGASFFETDSPATALYLLLEGGIDQYYVVVDRDDPKLKKEFFINELSPGDIFGLSGLIEPYQHTTSARASAASRAIKIEANGLRALCELDVKMSNGLMKAVARSARDRLHDTRVQLAAARA
jgi:CRP/FNR family transcriptional regulator, cyclic AMP receptor protein